MSSNKSKIKFFVTLVALLATIQIFMAILVTNVFSLTEWRAFLPLVVVESSNLLEVSPEEGGTIETLDFILQIPAFAVDEETIFSYDLTTKQIDGKSAVSQILNLIAVNSSGQGITQFNRPLTLTINYEPNSINENDKLSMVYSNDGETWVFLESETDQQSSQITAQITHFTQFAIVALQQEEGTDFEVGVGPGVDATVTARFEVAYNRIGPDVLGEPVNDVHEWGGAWVQDFKNGTEDTGLLIENANIPKVFHMPRDHATAYNNSGNPSGFLGLPVADPTTPDESALLMDNDTYFVDQNYVIQQHEGGFIGYDTNPANGDGYMGKYYYPIIEEAVVNVTHYEIPDPEVPTQTITVADVTVTVNKTQSNPPYNDIGIGGIYISSNQYDDWMPDHTQSYTIEELNIEESFDFRLEAWSKKDQAGYLLCNSYKNQLEGEEYLISIPLNVEGSYPFTNDCEGWVGIRDTEPPIITHNTDEQVWQNGKGYAIIAATITDNIGVAWAILTVNDEDPIPAEHIDGSTYVWIVPLKLGKNTYYFEAADPSGNQAREPEGEDVFEIFSEMAAAYGFRPWMSYTDDPINIGIGNFIYYFTDVTIPALGPDVDFTRWFNHQSQRDGLLGRGWVLPFDMHLTAVDNILFSGVQVQYTDGRVVNFEGDGSGTFTTPETVHDTLEQIGNEYLLITKKKEYYRFNDEGKLITIEDKDGNAITLTYDGDKLDYLTDASGRQITFTYDGDYVSTITIPDYGTLEYVQEEGELISVTNTKGETVTYTYDSETGCMVTITSPEGNPFLADQTCDQDRLVTYQLGGTGYVNELEYDIDNYTVKLTDPFSQTATHIYDEDFRVIEIVDPHGNSVKKTYNDDALPLTVTNANGQTTTYTYDEWGNTLTSTDPLSNTTTYTYDTRNNIKSRTDTLSNTWQYEYDTEDHLIKETNPLGGIKEYKYNDLGQIILEINELGHSTATTYNAQGLPETVTDALGNTTTYVYDEYGHLLEEINPLGHMTKYEHNTLGQLLSITDPEGNTTSYEYDGDQNMVKETNPDGYSRTFEFDENNRLIAESDWRGNITRYEYDDLGRKTAEIDPLGHTITYEYDELNRLIAMTDKRGARTTYTYDAHGNRLSETDALGNTTRYIYDELNRQVEIHRPCECVERIEYIVYDELGRVMERINANGNSTRFEYDELGRQIKRIDALGNETTFVYDAAGQKIKELDTYGNETIYTYDPVGRVIAITDRLGNTTYTTYDEAGRRVAETNARGFTTTYEFDDSGRLVKVIDALGGETIYTYDARGNTLSTSDANGHTTENQYDENGNVIMVTNARGYTTTISYDARNQISQTVDALGGITMFTYDPAGAQLTKTDALSYTNTIGYDILGRVISQTNTLRHTSTMTYDVAGNIATLADALGNTTTYTHDANGNILTEENPLGDITSYRYDKLNRRIETVDALGGISTTEYDALGRVVAQNNANGQTTTYEYDVEGQQIAVTDAAGQTGYREYDENGNLVKEIDRNGNVTIYTYDALDRLVTTTDALGHTETTVYDAVGNKISFTNKRGYTTQMVYDENNNLIELIDALNNKTAYTYDALDRRIAVTDANGHTTTSDYDAVSNLVQITLPEGQITTYTYDGEGNQLTMTNGRGYTTEYEYDALNRLVREISPMGYITATEYDALGRTTAAINALGAETLYVYDALGRLIAVVDPLGYETQYTYDAVGNRLTKVDANGNVHEYEYDVLNRLIGETDSLGNEWIYVYDPEGNAIEHVDANGNLIRYGFNAMNQMTHIWYEDETQNITYRYDENGNMVRMIDFSGITILTYDALDREVEKMDVYGRVTQNQFDPVGNRTAVIYPGGNANTFRYNGNNWLITATDPRGGQTHYSHEDDGQVRTTNYPNETWTTNTYDEDGRLISLFNGTTYNADVITAYQYVLDAVGNRIQVTEQYTAGQLRTNVKIYTYNARYELLESLEEYEGPPSYTVTTSYTYDPVGNRTSMTTDRDSKQGAVTTIYTYDEANRMLSANDITFTYDNNGNRTSKLSPAQPPAQTRLEIYEYDAQNRLTLYSRERVQSGQIEQRVYNEYDGLGRRVRKGTQEASGGIRWIEYAIDGLSYDQLGEYPQTGQPRETELYRGEDNQLISMDEIQGGGEGSQYWFASDGLESVSSTTKQNGQSAHEYFYDSYGQLIDENGHWEDSSSWTDPHNHYLLSGKEWDEESRMYYFGARYYDPQVGVWLTPDPLRGEANVPLTLHPYFRLGYMSPSEMNNVNDPMSLHRYLYVQNNPINKIDVNGYSNCGPYAKCREEEYVHPLIKFLFKEIETNWEMTLNVVDFLDNTIDLNLPDSKLEDFVEEYVQAELTMGYETTSSIEPDPYTGTLTTCKSFSPYVSGYLGAEFPIPGAYYEVPIVGGISLSVGGGIEASLSGEIEGCVAGDINIAEGLDLTASIVGKASITADLALEAYLKGSASILFTEASLSVGIRGGIEWPWIECEAGAAVGLSSSGIFGECDMEPNMTGYVDIFLDPEIPVWEWDRYEWRALESEFDSFIPNPIEFLTKRF